MEYSDDILDQNADTFEDSMVLIKSLKSTIKLKNSFFEILFNTIPNPIFYKDKDGIYQNCNDAFSKNILGISKKDIIGKSLYDFPKEIPKGNADIYYQKDLELLKTRETQFYITKVKCADGIERVYKFYKSVFVCDGEALGIVGLMMDITESEKQKEKLKYLSTIDPLTELFNRRYFYEIFKSILELDFRKRVDTSILMIDIDWFKGINDSFGHEVGDDVLISLSSLLKDKCRKSDVICRWGGEEFVVLLADTSLLGAKTIAEKIRTSVENLTMFVKNNNELKFTVSIGVSNVDDIANIDMFINRADKALYEAKKSGKNRVVIK